jgi:phosphopentomutase
MMTRAFLIVMDSVGCGGAPDAAAFGDTGANTLGHIALACAEGRADVGRAGPLRVPVLDGLGLGAAVRLASGAATPGLEAVPHGRLGCGDGSVEGQGHAIGALGIGRSAGAVGLGLFPRYGAGLSG